MRRRLPSDAGLSLLEILVAITIVAMVSAAVVFAVQPADDPLDSEADRLTLRLNYASQDAIATGQPVGLVIEEFGAGYAFYRYVDGLWRPLGNNPGLEPHRMQAEIRLSVTDAVLVEAEGSAVPVFWFDPAGLNDPFRLRLQGQGREIELNWTENETLERREIGA
ncbi:GspH/FimT family pseudopilin [Maricaulis sp.]|uniref:GspH/FimT family pseudopilin n=1 Tax=Maricaulis sp. TaxID=1486257 RepID=UPI0026311E9B|nr:GspH/FimT family pseudopilin [Maricaulis sp.]